MKKSTTFLLGLAGVTVMALLHWCTEPEALDHRPHPPKLTAKPFDENDHRVINMRAELVQRGSLGRQEFKLWQAADKKLAANPNDNEALYMRGNLMLDFHFLNYALDDANLLVSNEPDSTRAYLLRGQIYDAAGDTEQALADYTRAIAIAPNCGDAYYRRAKLYLGRGSPGLAASDLQKCKTAKFLPAPLPDRVNACPQSTLYYLGRAFEGIKQTEHALDAYQQYVKFVEQSVSGGEILDESYKQKDAALARINYIVPEVLNR